MSSRLAHWVLLACAVTGSGCMVTETVKTPLSPIDEEVLLRPESDEPALSSDFEVDGRLVRGHLAWTESCRGALVRTPRWEETVMRKPSYAGAVASGFGSVATGAAGVGLMQHLDDFSNEQHCETDDDGNEQCSSDREDATVYGVMLLSSTVALAATSIVTFASKRSASTEVASGPPGPPVVTTRSVACGVGAPAGLGVALYRMDERVAASVTDEDGNVTFRLPDGLNGPLDVAVDQVPPGAGVVTPGTLLQTLVIAP